MAERFIPAHGGYQNLLSYQKSEIIYDATIYFRRRFYSRGDCTIDQMVQSAQSGKQNIAEVSQASGTSKEEEISGQLFIRQANSSTGARFFKKWGFRERMYRARIATRNVRT